jgi:hypothetical protein
MSSLEVIVDFILPLISWADLPIVPLLNKALPS